MAGDAQSAQRACTAPKPRGNGEAQNWGVVQPGSSRQQRLGRPQHSATAWQKTGSSAGGDGWQALLIPPSWLQTKATPRKVARAAVPATVVSTRMPTNWLSLT